MSVLKFFNNQILKYSKKYYFIHIILSPFSALIQAGGIISIFPLITVATNPELVQNNKYFQKYYFFEYASQHELIIQLSFIFLLLNTFGIVLFFSNTLLGEFISSHSSINLKSEITKKILLSNLSISSERSNLINYIFYEIAKYQNSLSSVLSLYQNIVSLFLYFITVSLIEPRLFFLLIIIIISYITLYFISKNPLKKYSLLESENSKKITQIFLNINLGLKDLLVLKIGKKIHKLLEKFQLINVKIELKKKVLILYPRYIFEIILYLIFVLIIVKYYLNDFIQNNLGLFAVVGIFIWKSIPLLFNIFRSFSVLNSNISSYKKLINFSIFKKNFKKRKSILIKNFYKEINFKKVNFSYNSEKKFYFNFKIKKEEKVLLQGKSGSGKTTLLNLLTGLLKPSSGYVSIDNIIISDKIIKTNIFGYVTQEFLIFPGTLIDNLISGRRLNKKLLVEVKKVFHVCGLNNLVKDFNGLFTRKIEFNSPELSGGQRQRLAIARILMLNPKILVLDEATNGIDENSENEILTNIFKYYPKITLIMVSHRNIKVNFNKKIKI